jgi:hypothetical protein
MVHVVLSASALAISALFMRRESRMLARIDAYQGSAVRPVENRNIRG